MSNLHRLYSSFNSISSYLDRYAVERQLRRMGVGHAHRIHTHTTLSELHTLYRLAQRCPPKANILEIGSYLGASTCYIVAGAAQKGGIVNCVDTWMNETMSEGMRDTFAEFQENTKPIDPWLRIIRKHSELLVEKDVSETLDLVFIDGDHSYKSVNVDFQHTSHWLSIEGVIAFHDCRYYQDVSRVVGEAIASRQWVLDGCFENLCWIKRAPRSWAMAE